MKRSASRHLSLHPFTRSTAAALMLFASALTPQLVAAAPSVKLVVDSTDGQPNAGEPRLWTGHVYVVDGIAFGNTQPSPAIAYEGLAQVVYDPEDGAQTCLRFDQVLGNAGSGPLDIRFDQPAGVPPVDDQQIPVRQRIYRSDGSSHDSASGTVHWHAIHQHYHFDGFAQSTLWAIDSDGNRTGGAPIATGNKVSFCIATTSINPAYWGQQAFGPDSYPAPDCLEPYETSAGLDHFKQGMSVGWTDEYNWFLPAQYVEVTGVPDGDYILDTTVDPTSRLIEELKTNNCGSVRVRLSQMGTANPQAELLLEPGPPCE